MEQQTVEGVVSALVFQNEENGYTILRLELENEEITAVGAMPGVTAGEYLILHGGWTRHPSYGPQFKALAVERRLPQNMKEMYHYLACGGVKGVGKATARRLLEEFGENTLDALEDPEKLVQIKGITPKRAQQISASFRQQMGMRRLMDFLTRHQLPMELAVPLVRYYGDAALDLVRSNPYILAGEEFGVDFALADQTALSLGLDPGDAQRLEAGLLFELHHNCYHNGHSFVPWNKLIDATARLLDQSTDALEICLDGLHSRGEVVREDIAGVEAVYVPQLHQAECCIAWRRWAMSAVELRPPAALDPLIGTEGAEIVHAVQDPPLIELQNILPVGRILRHIRDIAVAVVGQGDKLGVGHRKQLLGQRPGQQVGYLGPGGRLLIESVELRTDDAEALEIGGIGGIPRPAAVVGGACLALAILVEAAKPGSQRHHLRHRDIRAGGEKLAGPLAVGKAQLIERLHILVVPGGGGDVGKLAVVGEDRREGAVGLCWALCPSPPEQSQQQGGQAALHCVSPFV